MHFLPLTLFVGSTAHTFKILSRTLYARPVQLRVIWLVRKCASLTVCFNASLSFLNEGERRSRVQRFYLTIEPSKSAQGERMTSNMKSPRPTSRDIRLTVEELATKWKNYRELTEYCDLGHEENQIWRLDQNGLIPLTAMKWNLFICRIALGNIALQFQEYVPFAVQRKKSSTKTCLSFRKKELPSHMDNFWDHFEITLGVRSSFFSSLAVHKNPRQ